MHFDQGVFGYLDTDRPLRAYPIAGPYNRDRQRWLDGATAAESARAAAAPAQESMCVRPAQLHVREGGAQRAYSC
jgi:hypothetical protein